jgi:hypothetical protein
MRLVKLPTSGSRYNWTTGPELTAKSSPSGESANPPQPKRNASNGLQNVRQICRVT